MSITEQLIFTIEESGTFLNLKIIDGAYKIVRPAGFQSVQWIIEVASYPNASHKW